MTSAIICLLRAMICVYIMRWLPVTDSSYLNLILLSFHHTLRVVRAYNEIGSSGLSRQVLAGERRFQLVKVNTENLICQRPPTTFLR